MLIFLLTDGSHAIKMRFSRRSMSRTCPICGYLLQDDIERDLASYAGSKSAAYTEAIVTHIQTVHPDFWNWQQSKRRLGFGLGIVTGALTGIGLFYLLAIVLQVPGGYWVGVIVIFSFVGFLVAYVLITCVGADHFRAQWREQGRTATLSLTRPVEPKMCETRSS